jgi:hypothetical protein
MTYFSKKNVIVRDSTQQDVDELSKKIRRSDAEEIWASHHTTPKDALQMSLDKSAICLTVEKDKEAVAMFGCVPESLLSYRASIWLLASDRLTDIQFQFLKYSKRFIKMMLAQYPYLHNYVDHRNKASREWLRRCGAKIEKSSKYGIEQMPFHYFSFGG